MPRSYDVQGNNTRRSPPDAIIRLSADSTLNEKHDSGKPGLKGEQAMSAVPSVRLNNGVAMPLLGFGVFQVTDLNECE